MPEERPEAEEEYIAEPLIKDMFRVLDKNRCGFLTCEEFKNLIGTMSEVSVSKEEMEELIEDVDKNRDGKVTYDENEDEFYEYFGCFSHCAICILRMFEFLLQPEYIYSDMMSPMPECNFAIPGLGETPKRLAIQDIPD